MESGATKAQHMVALERANEIRLGRVELKRKIGRGEKSVADVLSPAASLPEHLLGMAISELIRAQGRWGPTRTRRFLNRLEINENRPLGNLTIRQRRLLVDALRRSSRRRAHSLAA